MRPSVPKHGRVDAAFRTLARSLRVVQKGINSAAAKAMKRSEYQTVERWMEVGRSVEDFAGRASAFAEEWKRLVKAARLATAKMDREPPQSHARLAATPLWKFSEPVLRALAARGQRATTEELIAGLEPSLAPALNDKDLEVVPKHKVARWQLSVRRVRRLCEKEGRIAKRRDGLWELTPRGRTVALGKGDAKE